MRRYMHIQPKGVVFYEGLESDGHAFIDLNYKIGALANGRQYETELKAFHVTESAQYVYFGVNYIGQMQQETGKDLYYRYKYNVLSGNFMISGYYSKTTSVLENMTLSGYAGRVWALSKIPTKWTTQTMRLFGFNTTSPSICRQGCKVYYFKMADSGELVRDMIPCKYNNEYGMWDVVESKFYGNANTTGAFTPIGQEIQVYRTVKVKALYRKLNGTVTQIKSISRKIDNTIKQIF